MIVDRDLLVAVTLPIFEDRKQTPACPRIPILKRIVIVVFHVHRTVDVRVDRHLKRIMHPVGHSRIVFKIGRISQEEGDIPKLGMRQMACIHGRNLQIHVGVEGIDAAPAGIPLSGPHAIQPRCA